METMAVAPDAPTEDSARWLSEYEQSTWRSFLAMQRLIRDTLERQLQRDAAVPMTYYIILAMLSEAPERTLRMSELAVIAGTSQSQLSHAASRLEDSGWIERRRCESDKRGYLATLTDEGFEVLKKAAPSHVESVRSVLFDAITPAQVDQLRSICEDVLSHSCGEDSPMKYIVG
ncbi:MAG: MarR family winged helix-turn-helix transcriptional regulator [Actinomycetes bacterium]|jgi:DNA-binding MarR family transcriptional regulator